MQQVELQGPKLSVSAVGFGCGGLMQSPSRKERMAVLGSAVDSGMTHFDIARMYGLGMAEAELGAFLRTVDRDAVANPRGAQANSSSHHIKSH
jgi:D-threo-aldose 1-dehydrogenase